MSESFYPFKLVGTDLCIDGEKITIADVIADGTPLTHLKMACFVHQQEKELTSVQQNFWEIETCSSETKRERLRPE